MVVCIGNDTGAMSGIVLVPVNVVETDRAREEGTLKRLRRRL